MVACPFALVEWMGLAVTVDVDSSDAEERRDELDELDEDGIEDESRDSAEKACEPF